MATKKPSADDAIVAAWIELQPRLKRLNFNVPYRVAQYHPVVPWQMGAWPGVAECKVSNLVGACQLWVVCTESAAPRIRQYCKKQGWKEDA